MKRKKPINIVDPWPATERPGARFIASVGRHGGGSRRGVFHATGYHTKIVMEKHAVEMAIVYVIGKLICLIQRVIVHA